MDPESISALRQLYRQQNGLQSTTSVNAPALFNLASAGAHDGGAVWTYPHLQRRLEAWEAQASPEKTIAPPKPKPGPIRFAPPAETDADTFNKLLPVYIDSSRVGAIPAHRKQRGRETRPASASQASHAATTNRAEGSIVPSTAPQTPAACMEQGGSNPTSQHRLHRPAPERGRTRHINMQQDYLYPDHDTILPRATSAVVMRPPAAPSAPPHMDPANNNTPAEGDATGAAHTLLNPSDALLSTKPRAPAASFSHPVYRPQHTSRPISPGPAGAERQSANGCALSGEICGKAGRTSPGGEAPGSASRSAFLNPDYTAVTAAAPAAVFPKAPRWGSAGGAPERKPLPGAPKGEEERAAAQRALDVAAAQAAVLPRAPAAFISQAPRWAPTHFPEASDGDDDEDANDTWQQPRRFRSRWLVPKIGGNEDVKDGGEGTQAGQDQLLQKPKRGKAVQPKVKTAGVEAAIAFAKGKHIPGVPWAAPSVKEQIQKEVAIKLAAKREKLREQLEAAAAAPAGTTNASAQRAEAETEDSLAVASWGLPARARQAFDSPERMPAQRVEANTSDADGPTPSAQQRQQQQGQQGQRRGRESSPPPDMPRLYVRFQLEGMAGSSPNRVPVPLHAPTVLTRSISVQPQQRDITPSFDPVHRRAPSVAFGRASARDSTLFMPRDAVFASHHFSADPGPGAYAVAEKVVRAALSTAIRPPSAPFPVAPRVLHEVPAWQQPGPETLARWLRTDLGAATDKMLKPRVPSAFLNTAGPSRDAPAVTIEVEGEEEEGAGGGGGPKPTPLEVVYTLVEPRVKGTALIRAPPTPREPTQAEIAAEKAAAEGHAQWLQVDPWTMDRAVRARHPEWTMQGRADEEHAAEGSGATEQRPLMVLNPNWEALKPRVRGIPLFAHFLNTRIPTEHERLAALRAPAVGDYDMAAAWSFLQAHVPGVVMALAAARWRQPVEEALALGGDQAVLELAQAVDYVRPRAPAPIILPAHTHTARVTHVLGHAFGPSLSMDLEAAVAAVKPRVMGGVVFDHQVGRVDPGVERREGDTRHLGPTAYDVKYTVVEVGPHQFNFGRGQGHGILDSVLAEGREEGEEAELPLGARLQLDVLAAKDQTLRRPRAPVMYTNMLGREEVVPEGGKQPYGAYTNHLALPDPDLDIVDSKRHRVHQVVMEGPGHAPPELTDSPDATKRGPGAYDIASHGAVGADAPAFDFSRALGHPVVWGDDSPPPRDLEGDRLNLSPNLATVRPRPPAAIILPPHALPRARGSGEREDLYRDADYEYDLNTVRPGPRGILDFDVQLGRTPPDSPINTVDTRDYRVEDVPLHVLAGHAGPRGVLRFDVMRPHDALLPDRPRLEGGKLDLDEAAALDFTRPRLKGGAALDMEKQAGRDAPDPHQQGPDPELTAWLDYHPSYSLVKPAPASPPNLGKMMGREEARKAMEPDHATDDIDGGVYNPRHGEVWASPRAADFGHAQGRISPRMDHDDGNILRLNPQQPVGWQPKVHAEPTQQPMGRALGRWEGMEMEAGDEGNVLMLHTSQDDLARPRKATVVNTPAAVFGAMTASRYEVVVKPNENLPIKPSQKPQPRQTMETTLMMAPPENKALELLQKDPSNPMAAAFRRRERVWHRLMRRLETEHPQAEAARHDDALDRQRAHGDHAQHPLPKPHALVGEGCRDVAGRSDYVSAQARVPAGPREAAALAGIAEEERKAADAAKPPPRKQRIHKFKDAVFYQPPGPDAPPAYPPPDYQFRDGFFYRAVGMAPAQGQGEGGGKGGGDAGPRLQGAPHVGVGAGGLSGPAPQREASRVAEVKARKRERGERLRLRLPPDQLVEAAGGAQRGRQASPGGLAWEGAARVRWALQGAGVVGGAGGGGGGAGDGGGGRGGAISGGGGVGGGRGGAMGGAGAGGEGGGGWGLTYEGSPGAPTHHQEVEGARRRVVAAAIASAGGARQRRRMAPA